MISNLPYVPINRVKKYIPEEADQIVNFIEGGLPINNSRVFSTIPGSSGVKKTDHIVKDVFDQIIPTKNRDKMFRTRAIRTDISVVQSLVNFKLSLYTKNFTVSPEKKGKKFTDLVDEWSIKKIQKELHDDLLTQDNCILAWKTKTSAKNSKIEFVMRIRPEDAKVITIHNKDFLAVFLDAKKHEELDKIRLRPADHDKDLIREISRIPRKHFEAARLKKPIALSKRDGWNWAIGMKYSDPQVDNGLCKPSMVSIYGDALIVRYLENAELTTAYNLKNLILHIRHGESIVENGIVNNRYRTSTAKLRALSAKLNNLESSVKFFTDHTVNLEYIFPPMELFKRERFESVYFRIINLWGGMPESLFTGTGKTNIGNAFVSLKRVQIEGEDNRNIVKDVVTQFLAFAGNVKPSKVPPLSYDNDALRDERIKLEIYKFLKANSFVDFETTVREFGLDPEVVKARLLRDRKSGDFLIPVFEPSQGISAEVVHMISKLRAEAKVESAPAGKPGRPATTGEGPDKESMTGELDRSRA